MVNIGKTFAGTINNMSDDDISALSATMEVLTLNNVMSNSINKLSEKIPFAKKLSLLHRPVKSSAKNESLMEQINKRAEEIKADSTFLDLRWDLVEKIAKKTGYKKNVSLEEDDISELIYKCLLEISKDYKINHSGLTRQALLEKVMEKLFEDMGKEAEKAIKDMSPEEEEEILKKVKEEIYNLPPEKREQILKDLNLDELSGESLWKLFKSGALTGGTLMGAKACGFGLYLAATTIVHAIFTTLLGITLPFGFYTFLTSTIAFILNPFVAPFLVAALGFNILKSQEKKFDRKLLGICLFQIYVNSMV